MKKSKNSKGRSKSKKAGRPGSGRRDVYRGAKVL